MNLNRLKDNKFYRLCEENRYVLLSFFTAIGVCLLIAFCYDMVPFGNITILRMDLYHQYGPLFAELHDRLSGGASLIYSWQSGGGGSFLGNFFNYLSSPLSIITLFFKHINITDAIAVLIMLKAALSAGTFTYYLKASEEFKKHSAITAGFGLLYAFSGYFVAYYWNVMWLGGMVLLPIIILGIEKIVNGKSALTYVIALALSMISSYYMAYMLCIFSVLYAICYYFGKHRFDRKFFKSAARFIAYSIIAAGISAFALIPTYYALKTCSATSGSFPTEISTYFNIFDFLANHLASLEPTIRSSGDDVLPNIYCGVGTVMLAILYLYIKTIPLREKISKAVLLVFLFISFNINYLNYIWHGFHFPNDLPYRFSFIYSFILLIVAFKTILRIRELTGRDLLNVGFGMCVFIVLIEELGSKNVKQETIIISLVFVVIYTTVLSLLNNKKFQAASVASLLFCCMFAEVAIADTNNFDIDQPKDSYTSDYNAFREIKKQLDEREDGSFYRMELTDLRTRMDPCWYGYNGMSTFSSMAYENVANLQYNLGMFGNYINSYTYNLQTPVYNAMFSLKYIVNNSENVDLNEKFYSKVCQNETFTAYENKYCLPLAYCVPNKVVTWETDLNNPFEIQADYFAYATGLGGVFDNVPITEVTYDNITDFGEEINTGSFLFYKETAGETASFTLTAVPEKTQNLYIYVKSDNVESITVRDLEGNFNKYQDTEEEYIFDLGEHKAGEALYIDIPISEGDSGYVDAFIVGLNEDVMNAGFKKLNASGMKITEFDDTKISGTVTAENKCILYTSINYDNSWKVYVDGKDVTDTHVLTVGNALMGVRLEEGDHTITFEYKARGLYLGIVVSVFSLLLLLFITFIVPVLKVNAQNKNAEYVPSEQVPDEDAPAENAPEENIDVTDNSKVGEESPAQNTPAAEENPAQNTPANEESPAQESN